MWRGRQRGNGRKGKGRVGKGNGRDELDKDENIGPSGRETKG